MATAELGFFASWFLTIPLRLRGLVIPYFQGLGIFMAGYAGLTALLRPWSLGHWWSFGLPLAAGFSVCWWLWPRWALLARNSKGETRRAPLLVVWALLLVVGLNLREYLRYQLGEVHDVYHVQELAQPGKAVFFRLHGPFFFDKMHLGEYTAFRESALKGGIKRCYANCYYTYPLLAAAADTTLSLAPKSMAPPLAWLTYSCETVLGDNLTPGERNWRYQNFVARSDARLDSQNISAFTYLLRDEYPATGLYRAVRASRLAPYTGSPLLLTPVKAPFAARGASSLHVVMWFVLAGSVVVIFLLLAMPLRTSDDPRTW
jgi:hypothetical protein